MWNANFLQLHNIVRNSSIYSSCLLSLSLWTLIGKNIPALWNRNQETIVNRIRNQWNLLQFSEDEIHRICGILEVNCFEVGSGQNGTSARALFPEAYLMCHNCVPNTNHTDDPTTHELVVRSTRKLKKGDIISLSYAYTLQVRKSFFTYTYIYKNIVRCLCFCHRHVVTFFYRKEKKEIFMTFSLSLLPTISYLINLFFILFISHSP